MIAVLTVGISACCSVTALDLKNPYNADEGLGDVDHLLPEYEKLLAPIAATRGQLKTQLMEALSR